MKRLEEYSDDFKIRWFDEYYQMALDCFNDPEEKNVDIYKMIFFNAAMDLLKEKKELRIYEMTGAVIINAYRTSHIKLTEENLGSDGDKMTTDIVDLNQCNNYDFRIIGTIKQVTANGNVYLAFCFLDVDERLKIGLISGDHAETLLQRLRVWAKAFDVHPGGLSGGYWRINTNDSGSLFTPMKLHKISDELKEHIKTFYDSTDISVPIGKYLNVEAAKISEVQLR